MMSGMNDYIRTGGKKKKKTKIGMHKMPNGMMMKDSGMKGMMKKRIGY